MTISNETWNIDISREPGAPPIDCLVSQNEDTSQRP